jgi:hypothetical protein
LKVPAGWSALALKARTDRGDFFVKVYDRGKLSTRVWIERLDVWLAVAQCLRRRLEDIAAFLESILKDDLAPGAFARSAALLTRECDLLRAT